MPEGTQVGIDVASVESATSVTATVTRTCRGVSVTVVCVITRSWDEIEDMQQAVTDATSCAVSRALDQVDAALNGYAQVEGQPEEGQ